jgi:two-component system response regulator PilR (NtrC family)
MNRQILGESKAVKDLIGMINRVAGAKTNILVIGESGTGKELVARMIHTAGPLKDKPFIPVNCGAIPETLIESEMFGHARGSFTGAVSEKAGLFEAANGGTLFLDEVGELPLSMQVKLLRAIQERCFRKVGGTNDIKVDVRIIAATNRDLEQGVAKGTFREDLYYRLNVIQLKTPALRDRKGDVKLLAEAFLERAAKKLKKPLQGLEPDALAALEAHTWPGNIRELENVIERATTLESGSKISFASLPSAVKAGALASNAATAAAAASASGSKESNIPAEIRLPAPDFSKGPLNLDEILGQVERTYLTAALEVSGGVRRKAAELLGITLRSLRYRLTQRGFSTSDDEASEDA